MANNKIGIEVKALFKSFQLDKELYTALSDISFQITQGERVGIIGENGAGKTTLLNILCGFLQADSGERKISGNINALMSLGVGLKEELSGRENIYADGELHNISRVKVDSYLNDIISFTDIGEYIDKPVKIYSSGMKARLMFSIATMIEPEILIIDEVLGVGDAEFSKKASKRIEELCSEGQILIVVSHSMGTIRSMTDRVIWLENGKIKHDGDSNEVANLYQKHIHEKEEKNLLEQFKLRQEVYKYESSIVIDEFYLESDLNKKTLFYVNDFLGIILNFNVKEKVHEWDIKISILRMDGTLLLENYFTQDMGMKLPELKAGDKKEFKIDFGKLKLSEGTFEVLCEILDMDQNILAQSFAVMQILNNIYKYTSKPEYFCEYDIVSEE